MVRLADIFRLPGRKLTPAEAQQIAGPLPRYTESVPDRIRRLRKEAAQQRIEAASIAALEMLPQALEQLERLAAKGIVGWAWLDFSFIDTEQDFTSRTERRAARSALLELLKAQGFKTRHCRETKRAYESWEVKLPK